MSTNVSFIVAIVALASGALADEGVPQTIRTPTTRSARRLRLRPVPRLRRLRPHSFGYNRSDTKMVTSMLYATEPDSSTLTHELRAGFAVGF